MNPIKLYNDQIAFLNNNKELTDLLINQIKKDFGNLIHSEPQIKSQDTYLNLYNWIYPIIEELAKTDRGRLTSLIYTVDAGFIKKRFNPKDGTEVEQWTHAILIRECLKLFIRLNYKAAQEESSEDFPTQ